MHIIKKIRNLSTPLISLPIWKDLTERDQLHSLDSLARKWDDSKLKRAEIQEFLRLCTKWRYKIMNFEVKKCQAA